MLKQDIRELFSALAQAGLDVAILPVRFVAIGSDSRIFEQWQEQVSRPHDICRAILSAIALRLFALRLFALRLFAPPKQCSVL